MGVMELPVRTPEQLASVLRGVRAERGLTQQELADRIGLLQKAISAMEHTPGKSSVDRLFKLLSGLGVELVLRDRAPSPGKRKTDW
jgi:HTH-type transcriptional regulator / antitoxin HipB